MAKKPDVRSALEKTAQKLERRFADIEDLARDNRRILELQFKRMAAMQGDLDRLLAHMKRST
jgi:hypothetical protein